MCALLALSSFAFTPSNSALGGPNPIMTPSIVVDASSSNVSITGTHCDFLNSTGSTFAATLVFCPINATSPSTISYTFNGTGVDIFGSASSNTSFNYTLDGSSGQQVAVNAAQAGSSLWSIADLPEGNHTLALIPTSGNLTLDYFLSTPSNDTILDGVDLLYDDTDESMEYHGTWPFFVPPSTVVGTPLNTTLHETRTKGDGIFFRFVGSHIAIYGALNQKAGNLSTMFDVDREEPQTLQIFDGTQEVKEDQWEFNHLLFEQDVDPGEHVLTLVVEEVTGDQAFYLDYIVTRGINITMLESPQSDFSQKFPEPTASSYIGIMMVGAMALAIIACLIKSKLTSRQIQRRAGKGLLPPMKV
ncbi:hypothetical protein BDN72DRAFT_963347 [Pluteus cervinus]|uniref:Uncharacterized protein n=1 Tax=Pluteus cervinus TaxID=181527 RepID=A0ACD3AEA3_9AGAR|nr:hypothetical protein BDN72DRAFT_963347 [Pluteus cervinus]